MSSTLLDDLLPPEQLAALRAKREKKARTDLRDLLPEKPKLSIELLPAIKVLYRVQINRCKTCSSVVELPLGMVAMHPLKRNGRITSELVGVALREPNDYPELTRTPSPVHSESICCSNCVAESRFIPRTQGYVPPNVPLPGTPAWEDQFGYGRAEEIHARAEELRRRAELLERELEESAERNNLNLWPQEIQAAATQLRNEDENFEPTLPEDAR